jgi:predicted methyltransferase
MNDKKLKEQVEEIGNALAALHQHMQYRGYYFEDSTLPLFKQVVSALYEFDRIKLNQDSIKLTEEDTEFLLKLLENPPEPNDALKRAFERRKMLINNTDE